MDGEWWGRASVLLTARLNAWRKMWLISKTTILHPRSSVLKRTTTDGQNIHFLHVFEALSGSYRRRVSAKTNSSPKPASIKSRLKRRGFMALKMRQLSSLVRTLLSTPLQAVGRRVRQRLCSSNQARHGVRWRTRLPQIMKHRDGAPTVSSSEHHTLT